MNKINSLKQAPLIIVIITAFLGCLAVYKITTSTCLHLYSGNTQVTVNYAKEFVNESFADQIRINKSRGDNTPILLIDKDQMGYIPVDTLIGYYKEFQPGPMYTTKTFLGGYEAALAEHTEENSLVSKLYLVPIGNTTISIQYFPENLTPEEGKIAEKMLQSISFKTGKNVEKEAVKACKWLH